METEFLHLMNFAKDRRLRVRRDECNEAIIPGRRGQIYQHNNDGSVFGVMYMPFATKDDRWGAWTPRRWGMFKRAALAIGMTLLQNGDSEGCLAFDPATDQHVELALKIAKVIRRRQLTPEQRMRAIERLGSNRSDALKNGGLGAKNESEVGR